MAFAFKIDIPALRRYSGKLCYKHTAGWLRKLSAASLN